MGRSTFHPETELASTIAVEVRTVFRKVKRHLREQGEHGDLTPSQVSVVLRLEESGPATVSGLARAEGMRPQSMSAVMTALQEGGLVTGTPDPNDGRQTLMSLTPKCFKWLKEVAPRGKTGSLRESRKSFLSMSRKGFAQLSVCCRSSLRSDPLYLCLAMMPAERHTNAACL